VRTRVTDFDGREAFEAVKTFTVNDVSYGLFRVGLSMEAVRASAVKIKHRVVLVSLLLFGFVLAILSVIEARQRKDRMTAMGELASGVAHEIRNPLNAIGMIVQRFEREFMPTEGVEEYRTLARTVRSEVDRVNAIIRQFLDFARPPKLYRKSVDLDMFLDETATIVASKAEAKGIALHREFGGGGILSLDREQMKQAVLNLLINAIDATPAGGRIALRSVVGDKGVVVVEVTDTGSGIPQELRNRIFDPYFTTKEEGMGMGLSLTHRIVAEHGGSIEVESEVGKGSTFRIKVPQ
jgi:signal transduction histidine kinase